MFTARNIFGFALSVLLLSPSVQADEGDNSNGDDYIDSNAIPCGEVQCYFGGECVNLDAMHPCQCPLGFGGMYCDFKCDHAFQEGPRCGEWRVNTPICREPGCEEAGIIGSKVYDENSNIVYTLIWDEAGEEEVSVNLSNGEEGWIEQYAWSYIRSIYAFCECQNGGGCNLQINDGSQNGASPSNSIESVDLYCECPVYASGEFCEVLQDCDLDCQNGGACTFDRGGGQVCSCPINFFGLLCDVECTLDCQNDGHCFAVLRGNDTMVQSCSCGFYFEGDLCETERTCDLECENDGKCELGQNEDWLADEFWEICREEYGGDCPEGFFYESPDYCNCPPEWTGLTCTETCPCENGGTCSRWGRNRKLDQDENDEWNDDARWNEDDDAVDNGHYCSCPFGYYGSGCQFESFTGECTMECQNGGRCYLEGNEWADDDQEAQEGPPTAGFQFCACEYGFEGDFCEIELDGCRLACQNGGICTNEEVSIAGHDRALEDWSVNDEYCGCTEGFFGELCERKACGSGYCENGAGCIVLPSGQTAPDGEDYVCDCSVGFSSAIYAGGRHCESMTDYLCEGLTTEVNPNEPWYCTNYGRCFLDDSGSHGCDCSDGYEGPRCEYVSDAGGEWSNCGLSCENGGACLKGVVKPVAQIFSPFLETTNGLFDYAPTDNFEYCYCQAGFLGVQCENQYEFCEGGEHICFHGSTCQENGDQWECDCTEVSAAGLYCQHEATEICDDQDAANKFCANNGACSSTADTICDCVEGWEGANCEVKSSVSNTAGGADNEWSGAMSFRGAFSVSVFLVSAVLQFIVF